jgi:Fe-S-cluster containining protein
MSIKECDCHNGQSMGCKTYCCRLIVRLTPHECQYFYPDNDRKMSLDKDSDGYCVYLDKDNSRCRIWSQRPQACREFNCNADHKLQHVLKSGVVNIVALAQMSVREHVPHELWVQV